MTSSCSSWLVLVLQDYSFLFFKTGSLSFNTCSFFFNTGSLFFDASSLFLKTGSLSCNSCSYFFNTSSCSSILVLVFQYNTLNNASFISAVLQIKCILLHKSSVRRNVHSVLCTVYCVLYTKLYSVYCVLYTEMYTVYVHPKNQFLNSDVFQLLITSYNTAKIKKNLVLACNILTFHL